ncbi:hypothetical protein FACS1894169_08300 [Bacteroidia bacterium]|nr:hypothetical protein FACS1894169_08300 [Bacteroidia bacterium]
MIIFMKTIFKTCLVAIALLVGINTYAQDKPIAFGVKAGVNLSNFSGDLGGDAKIGFNVGVTLDYGLSPDLYLLTGLDYSLQGTKEGDSKINLSYLKLPIHLGYKLLVADNTKIVFRAGPYVGFAVDGKYKRGAVSVDAFNKDLEDVLGFKYNRFDFGLGLGVGLEFGKIGVGLGYDFGLVDIVDTGGLAKIKNMNAYLTLGYKF